jgi:hypothetical protein
MKPAAGQDWSHFFRLADKRFSFLVHQHGFNRTDESHRWWAQVTFEGAPWSLFLYYGDRDFVFTADVILAGTRWSTPRPLWTVLEAYGAGGEAPVAESRVDDRRLSRLMTAAASAITKHWDVLSTPPTEETLRNIERILNRYARRIRREGQ